MSYQSTHTGQQIDQAVNEVANKQDTLVSGSNIKTINNQSILGSGNMNIYKVKTTLDNILNVNTQYYLGTQSSLNLTLPSTASAGDIITVDFESGTTATTLSISGNIAGDIDYTPIANSLVELNFKYDGTYWKMLVSSINTPTD